jgi:hypothetical protein
VHNKIGKEPEPNVFVMAVDCPPLVSYLTI